MAKAACKPELDDAGQLVVDGHAQALSFSRDRHFRLPRLAVWPYRSDAVLVADKPRRRINQGNAPGGTLWLVACDGLLPPIALYREAGADFGNAALSADHAALYYSGPMGIAALDLSRRTTTAVTIAPPLHDDRCQPLYGARAPTHHTDLVRSLDRKGRLRIERGSHCGFEGNWDGERQVIGKAV
ncbi:MAG: hypothetical protein K0V04_33950, partial [Deltaproteobacteria bacterium]|nr:hypothetical protein [Deltaproteobacteria bacterium]